MGYTKVGIQEFREKLAYYLLNSRTPVAITGYGRTFGYYIPIRKRSESERAALDEAVSRLWKAMEVRGITEEEIIADFELWRARKRK